MQEQHSGADLRWEGTKFMELVRRAERHEFTDLICLNRDRFCRGGATAYLTQLGLLANANVTLHFVQEDGVSVGNPLADGLNALMADVAQLEREKTRERSMRVRTATAEAGFITLGATPPFGFRWVEDPTQPLTKKGHTRKVGLEPDPVTGPALLHLTQHVANGGSIREAQRWLTQHEIPTPRGKTFRHVSGITRILRNPTNYGARRSFMTRVEQREGGVRRSASLKTRTKQVPRPEDEQYPVKAEYVTPIPGLTYDLWRRALAQLAENKTFSTRNAHLPLEELVQHALLRAQMIHCAVCGHALTRVHNRVAQPERYRYVCRHNSTPLEGVGIVSIEAPKLDTLVWESVREYMRDPDFFKRVLAQSDAVNSPAVRVASLTRQLADAASVSEKLMKQLAQLDADDELVADYQMKLRANKAERDELTRDLDVAQAAAHDEETRRATLTAFARYAATERDRLDAYTALEKHELLRALRTRVIVDRGFTLARVTLTFDLRYLPAGAEDAFSVRLPTYEELGGRAWLEQVEPVARGEEMVIDLSDTSSVGVITALNSAAHDALTGRAERAIAERLGS